jgi:DNA-binding protein HU-beta
MTTQGIRNFLAKEMGMKKPEIDKAVFGIAMAITEGLKKDDYVRFSGLGVFKVKIMREHMGTNPQTREPMVIPARRVVRFKLAENVPR